MEVVAKFTGKHGSKGYLKGQVCTLEFTTTLKGVMIYDKSRTKMQDGGAGGLVEYSSLKSFLNNWEVIR